MGMKKIIPIFFLMLSMTVFAQSPVGQWRTIDDIDKKERAIIDVFQKDNKLYGKIIKTFPREGDKSVCESCEGKDKDSPILGLEILKGVSQEALTKTWSGGTILDPKNGKTYKVYLELQDDEGKKDAKLKVRGYIGFSLLGRTQYWYRYEESKPEVNVEPLAAQTK